MSFKRKIDKQAVVHHAMSCHGILHRKKKEQAINTRKNLVESQGDCIEWKLKIDDSKFWGYSTSMLRGD